MAKIKVNLARGLHWPDRCAHCNEPASRLAKSHYRVVDGFFIVAIRETTHTFTFPVCARHRWAAWFYGWMTNQAWPTGFCMTLLAQFLFVLLAGFTFKITDEVVYAILAITPLIVLFLKARNPLKVVGVKNGEVTLRVLHADYADSLSRLNAQGGAGASR